MGMLLGKMHMMKGVHGKRKYTLTGTEGSPTSRIWTATDPDDAEVDWTLTGINNGNARNVGYMEYDERDAGDLAVYDNQHQFTTPPTDWGTLYFRLTYGSGSDTASFLSHAIDGTTWHTLTEGVNNIYWTAQHTAVPDLTVVTVKVEMATDAAGTNIVATGWYRATAQVESGA